MLMKFAIKGRRGWFLIGNKKKRGEWTSKDKCSKFDTYGVVHHHWQRISDPTAEIIDVD